MNRVFAEEKSKMKSIVHWCCSVVLILLGGGEVGRKYRHHYLCWVKVCKNTSVDCMMHVYKQFRGR